MNKRITEEPVHPERYYLRLCTGEIIEFTGSQLHDDYYCLDNCRIVFPDELTHYSFPNGIDIHKNAIVWEAYMASIPRC